MLPCFFFVYGTLKRGYGNNLLLHDSKLVGQALTEPAYILFSHGIPFAVRLENKNKRSILGEVYEVTREGVVRALDQLEGNGTFYTRHLRDMTLLESKESIKAWIYEIPSSKEYYQRADLCRIDKESGAYYWSRG